MHLPFQRGQRVPKQRRVGQRHAGRKVDGQIVVTGVEAIEFLPEKVLETIAIVDHVQQHNPSALPRAGNACARPLRGGKQFVIPGGKRLHRKISMVTPVWIDQRHASQVIESIASQRRQIRYSKKPHCWSLCHRQRQ